MTNTNPVAALIVRPDGTAEIRDVAPDLETLQGLVGGFLEPLRPSSAEFGAWHAYVDEEGALKPGNPANHAATDFARSIGWAGYKGRDLTGPVVFLSATDEGDEADVPPEVVGAAVRLWGLDA